MVDRLVPVPAMMRTVADDGQRAIFSCPEAPALHWSEAASLGDAGLQAQILQRYQQHYRAQHPYGPRRLDDESRCGLCRRPLGMLKYRSSNILGVYCKESCRAEAETRPAFRL